MTEKEKLVELINEADSNYNFELSVGKIPKPRVEYEAEFLLKNGVIVMYGDYKDEDGAKALKKAMSDCFYSNNAVTRYTADAIAEKLCKEEAEKALAEKRADND